MGRAVGAGDLQDHAGGAGSGGRSRDGVSVVRAVAGAHRLAERDDAAVGRVDLHGILQAVEVLPVDVERDGAGLRAAEVKRGRAGLGCDTVDARRRLDGDLARGGAAAGGGRDRHGAGARRHDDALFHAGDVRVAAGPGDEIVRGVRGLHGRRECERVADLQFGLVLVELEALDLNGVVRDGDGAVGRAFAGLDGNLGLALGHAGDDTVFHGGDGGVAA